MYRYDTRKLVQHLCAEQTVQNEEEYANSKEGTKMWGVKPE